MPTAKKSTAAKKRSPRQFIEQSMQSLNRQNTQKRAASLALKAVRLQKTAFDRAIDGLGRVQDQSAKLLQRAAKNASWTPDEGKEIVNEWIQSMERGRNDFKKTMDSSFDLLKKYFERVETKAGGSKPKASTTKKSTVKKAAPKKKPAKRKAATKKKASGS